MRFDDLPSNRKHLQCGRRLGQIGFTVIELIMVIVMLGVLAVFAAPRMFNTADFNARGLHDKTLAYLRYAQKTAIAQRRTVCVSFSGNDVSLRIAKNASNTVFVDCAGAAGSALSGPDGKTSGSVSGAVYTSTVPATFDFDGLGQPVSSSGVALASAPTVQVTNAIKSITVERMTGYVHD